MGVRCPACGSAGPRAAFRRGPRYLRCVACASLFDPEPPSVEELREIYSGPQYFVKDGRGGAHLRGYPDDYLENRPNVESKFREVLGHLERYVSPGRMLDVGCGPGFMLGVARDRGWEPVGLELNAWAADHARSELGADVRTTTIEEAGLAEGGFDAVTMLDLIEHVPDPDSLVAEAARVVRGEGALAVLTPDAGSPVSRALGRRWPEVRRPGEHTVLFSRRGLVRLLARHGFVACGWHPTGKTAKLKTLVADASPLAPGLARRAGAALDRTRLGEREVELDPRTKLCLYARRVPVARAAAGHMPARIPKRPGVQASVEGAILEELEHLAEAERYCDWLFAQFEHLVRGDVAEVGPGIGTFSRRILDRGADSLLLLEPEPGCAAELERRFAGEARVRLVREELPAAPSLESELCDLVVCQNVLEHVSDDAAAVARMAAALRPGGSLALLVPAGPRLYGPLDEAYGHRRRYTREDLTALTRAAGLDVATCRAVNAPGIAAWWLKNRRPGARVGPSALRAYEGVVRIARPIEERIVPPVGLTLSCLGLRPG